MCRTMRHGSQLEILDMIYHSCQDAHLFHCHMIHEGMLYKCAVPPFLPPYLDKMNMSYDPCQDGFAIHQNSDLYKGLRDYLGDPAATEACRYCLGYVGKQMEHQQLSRESLQDPGVRPIDRKSSVDYSRFAQEVFRYLHRRAIEKLTGKPMW